MNFAIDPEFGWLTDSGPLIRLTESEMAQQGLEIVMKQFSNFDRRIYQQGEFANMSLEQKRKFDQSHDLIWISLKSKLLIELEPMSQIRGKPGFQGDPKNCVKELLPTTPEKLWKSILLAYSRC